MVLTPLYLAPVWVPALPCLFSWAERQLGRGECWDLPCVVRIVHELSYFYVYTRLQLFLLVCIDVHCHRYVIILLYIRYFLPTVFGVRIKYLH